MPRSGIEIEKSERNSSRNASNSWSERSNSSINSSLSGHGSLLDEVIVEEETELNSSTEMEKVKLNNTMSSSSAPYANYFSDTSRRVPVMIEASPNKTKKRKSKSNNKERSRSRSSDIHKRMADATARLQTKRSVGDDPDDDDNEDEPLLSGYESGSGRSSRRSYSDAASDDDRSGKKNHVGGMISDAEESFSSRAARARRNRLLSKQQRVHAVSGNIPTTTTMPPNTMSVQPIHPIHVVHVDRGMNNRRPPTERVEEGGKNGNTEQHSGNTAAWEARKVRMARLRANAIRHHQQQYADNTTTTSHAGGQCSDNNEAIIRAHDGIALDCSSDGEDSI